jgi:hypothetical protein
MSQLFSLPDVLMVGVLVSWVGVVDIGRLDTAMCNKCEREHFLKFVSQSTFVIQNPCSSTGVSGDAFAKWIMERQIAVSNLIISGILLRSSSERLNYLMHCGKVVRRVEVQGEPGGYQNRIELFRDLCENCPNVLDVVCEEELPPAAQVHIAVHWKQLTDLTIRIEDAGPEFISLGVNCQSLVRLELRGYSQWINGGVISSFDSYKCSGPPLSIPVAFLDVCSPRLLELTAGRSLISDHYIALAKRCPNLRKLDVSNGTLMDDALIALAAGCRSLHHLRLYHTFYITDVGLIEIALNGALTTLCVDGPLITDAAFQAVAEHCPQLEHVTLACCHELTDATLIALGQRCHNLREIDMTDSKMTRVGLNAIAAGCPLLQFLRASKCGYVGPGIEPIARHCPRLRALYAERMPAEAVLALAECCPLLEDVSLGFCKSVNDEAITALARGCPALRSLSIIETAATAKGLAAIREHCAHLSYLAVEESMFPEETFDDAFFPPSVKVEVFEVCDEEDSDDLDSDYDNWEEPDLGATEESGSSAPAGSEPESESEGSVSPSEED